MGYATMSTYTHEQEVAMAKSCMWHRDNSPHVYGQFLMMLGFMTGEHPQSLDKKIHELANS